MKITVKRKKVKYLRLTVADENNVYVTAPLEMTDAFISRIIREKQSWINKKIALKRHEKAKYDTLFSSEKVLLGGKEFNVTFADVPNACCVDNFLILPRLKSLSNELTQKAISDYLMQIAKKILPKRVSYWGEMMSLCPTAIKIKNYKSSSTARWGTCNGLGQITLNCKLVQLPEKLMDYVVIHELCHLKNLNHSEEFWAQVSRYVKDLNVVKSELRSYGFLTTINN